MRIPVVEGQELHSGVRVVSGSIPIRILLNMVKVPYRDALKKTGYQRKPQDARITRFTAELRTGHTDVPTSILLNSRKGEQIELEKIEGGHLFLHFDESSKDYPSLYVVDGQHRVLAFEKLYKENNEKWNDISLQFVLMLGATENEEVEQFYTVNTTAKSVKTDLALDLLKQRAEADGRVMKDAIARGYDWKIEGQAIVDELYQTSPIWKDKIQLANEAKASTIIPAASFVTSLKILLSNSPFFKKLQHAQRVEILNAYWLGIREAMREPFDQMASHYALQKGIGVNAMHDMLPTVIEIVRSNGDSVFEIDAYRKIMEPVLAQLSGDNVEGLNVLGAEFWLTAPRGGAAGSFSSSAGKRVLFAKLRNLLPEIAVE